uniref:Putative nuclease HARBI1 n=1 Tax=Takifugu rubripes TaxID=31033 RepID=A0A674MSP0_TAKRU
MAYLLLLQDIADRALRRERMFRDHIDLFAESDEFLLRRFRLTRPVLIDLCNQLEPALRSHTLRSNPVPPHVQVLSVLGFLATGTFQRVLGDRVGISQPSISRALPRVLDGINQLATQYIKFPYTPQYQVTVKRGFHNIAGLPNTIGAIDCTHVSIKAPSPDSFPYLNRKQYHSINVQLISAGDAWLIGDRGYALAPWLLTPLTNPQTPQEMLYNQMHARSRCTIERTIGILKGRWMCLDTAGGKLPYKPERVCRIIMACCVLHNIAMKRGQTIFSPSTSANERPSPDTASTALVIASHISFLLVPVYISSG